MSSENIINRLRYLVKHYNSVTLTFMTMCGYQEQIARNCEFLHWDRGINTSFRQEQEFMLGIMKMEFYLWKVITVGYSESGVYFCFCEFGFNFSVHFICTHLQKSVCSGEDWLVRQSQSQVNAGGTPVTVPFIMASWGPTRDFCTIQNPFTK